MKFGVFVLPALSGGDGRRWFSFLGGRFETFQIENLYWRLDSGSDHEVPQDSTGLFLQNLGGYTNSAFLGF